MSQPLVFLVVIFCYLFLLFSLRWFSGQKITMPDKEELWVANPQIFLVLTRTWEFLGALLLLVCFTIDTSNFVYICSGAIFAVGAGTFLAFSEDVSIKQGEVAVLLVFGKATRIAFSDGDIHLPTLFFSVRVITITEKNEAVLDPTSGGKEHVLIVKNNTPISVTVTYKTQVVNWFKFLRYLGSGEIKEVVDSDILLSLRDVFGDNITGDINPMGSELSIVGNITEILDLVLETLESRDGYLKTTSTRGKVRFYHEEFGVELYGFSLVGGRYTDPKLREAATESEIQRLKNLAEEEDMRGIARKLDMLKTAAGKEGGELSKEEFEMLRDMIERKEGTRKPAEEKIVRIIREGAPGTDLAELAALLGEFLGAKEKGGKK